MASCNNPRWVIKALYHNHPGNIERAILLRIPKLVKAQGSGDVEKELAVREIFLKLSRGENQQNLGKRVCGAT